MKSRDLFSKDLSVPIICAPMFLVTTPEMTAAACKSGIIGVLPRGNFRSASEFEDALGWVSADVANHAQQNPTALIGPLAVNLAARAPDGETAATLDICRRFDVRLLITALGHPADVVAGAKAWGAAVYHDVISLQFAEKAIAAGVDGLIAVCWGGGGHSGLASPMVLIPQLRARFDGAIVMAGGVATGSAIRAAQTLGADLAYVGTRFVGTRESGACDAYKKMLVEAAEGDVLYTDAVNGVGASWLRASLSDNGLDPAALPRPTRLHGHDHLPDGVRPWRDLWSAGQAAALIEDLPPVHALVARLKTEYELALRTP